MYNSHTVCNGLSVCVQVISILMYFYLWLPSSLHHSNVAYMTVVQWRTCGKEWIMLLSHLVR
jgi:hypothetical protein